MTTNNLHGHFHRRRQRHHDQHAAGQSFGATIGNQATLGIAAPLMAAIGTAS